MGRSQVLFNQRKGRGRGRGSGRGAGRSSANIPNRRINRPKWSAENSSDENLGNEVLSIDESETLDHEVSLLEANVSSQRHVMTVKHEETEALTLTLNMFHSDPPKLKQQMNYALNYISSESLYRIPSRLISTATTSDYDSDIQEDITVLSSLSSVTAELRATQVLADPVASRLGIQNLPSKQKVFQRDQHEHHPKIAGRLSLLGVMRNPDINHANDVSKSSLKQILPDSEELNMPSRYSSLIESKKSLQRVEEDDMSDDLIMRLRSLPSEEHKDLSNIGVISSNEEEMDEWLKETLNGDETSKVKEKKMVEETLDEEQLEDWLDSII